MSKTAQRKREMFRQGQDDYLSGRQFRWERHPLIGYYAQGYFEAKRQMVANLKMPDSFWKRVLWLLKRLKE